MKVGGGVGVGAEVGGWVRMGVGMYIVGRQEIRKLNKERGRGGVGRRRGGLGGGGRQEEGGGGCWRWNG